MSFDQVLYAPWIVLGLVWLVSGFMTKRTAEREPWLRRASYGVPLVAASALLFTGVLHDVVPALDARVLPDADGVRIAGTVLACAGVAFAIWARLYLGRNWSGAVTIKEDHALVTSGPYAIVRHPIYTGVLSALLGSAVVVGNVRACIAFPVFVAAFAYKLSTEDKLMRAHFGEAHVAWSARVKRLVPLVW